MRNVRILADSISLAGHRLITFECTFPRIILAEVNTHRVFSRNSASSRAISVKRMIEMAETDPYIPSHWGKNEKGMSASEQLSPSDVILARDVWLRGRDRAVAIAREMLERFDLHKQLVNRVIEPYVWHTAVITATDWSNWYHQRDNRHAHPDIQEMARAMKACEQESEPRVLSHDDWHLPFINVTDEAEVAAWSTKQPTGDRLPSQLASERLVRISVARCARVSYLTQDGKRDHEDDVKMYDRLVGPGHMSPLEHVARPMKPSELAYFARAVVHFEDGEWTATGAVRNDLGNLNGWVQHRKEIPFEYDILKRSK